MTGGGGPVGVEGLGHLRDGSGQTGLRGWAGPPRGPALSFSLEDEEEEEEEEEGMGGGAGNEEGVPARRWARAPWGPAVGLGVCFEEPGVRGVAGREAGPLARAGPLGVVDRGSCVGFLGGGA